MIMSFGLTYAHTHTHVRDIHKSIMEFKKKKKPHFYLI